MKVENMRSPNGHKSPNQFIIWEEGRGALGNFVTRQTFQSYNTIVAIKTVWPGGEVEIELDANCWDYSRTTGKYRNRFLGETKRETEKKIKSGEYILTNLN